MTNGSKIAFLGCSPEPLSSYLKALAVLRILSEQADPDARGWWQNEVFHITTRMGVDELVEFFLDRYVPTPVTAPWNGGSGYWDTSAASRALVELSSTTNPRLEPYRKTIAQAHAILAEIGASGKLKRPQKDDLVRMCRLRFPDEAVEWLDAVVVMSDEGPRYPPILGTGGNDGRLEFTSNFIHNLLKVVDRSGASGGAGRAGVSEAAGRGGRSRNRGSFDRAQSEQWLRDALFGGGGVPLSDTAVGQFNPGGVGGPNAIGGFEGPSLVNPWDFVLMIEGALMFAGSVVWRLNSSLRGSAAFPFTVETSSAGWGSLNEGRSSARGEMWLPTWEKPALYVEVKKLFSEGRAQVGRRAARTGVDFARAAASLGVDRGVTDFRRYGFLQRSGKAYLSTPLGRIRVRDERSVRLLEQIDSWLEGLRRVAEEDGPAGIKRAFRAIGDAIFLYCERGGKEQLQRVLRALGQAERTVAKQSSRKTRERLRPLQGLGPEWIRECDDGSPEFRLAVSLASIYDGRAGPIRQNLEPVGFENGRWRWDETSLLVVPDSSDIVRVASAILVKRLLLAKQKQEVRSETRVLTATEEAAVKPEPLPIRGRFETSLADIDVFLCEATDDSKILDLLWGLIAVDWRKWKRSHGPQSARMRSDLPGLNGGERISRAYALLKILFLPEGIEADRDQESITVKVDEEILSRLTGGDVDRAIELAVSRLRSNGVIPLGTRGARRRRTLDFVVSAVERRRMLASLLFPTWEKQVLSRLVIAPDKEPESFDTSKEGA